MKKSHASRSGTLLVPKSSLRPLIRLKPYLRPYYGLLLGSFLLAIPLSAIRTAPAPLVKYIIDDLFQSRSERKLMIFPLLVVGLYVVNFFVRFAHYYLLRIVVARVNQRLKNQLFEHLIGLSADYFTAQSTGTLISRVASDPQNIDGGLQTLNVLVREPITFLFLFGYALKLNWRLTLLMFIIFPPLAFVFGATGRNLKRYVNHMNVENARLFSVLQESFSGVRVVKMFRLEKYVRKRFRDSNDRYVSLLLKSALMEEASHPMVELLTSFAIAGVVYFGGRYILAGTMTPGDLLAFFAAFAMMMNPIRLLNDLNIKLHTAAAACDRIFEIFDWKAKLHESANPIAFRSFSKEVHFNSVSFAYPDAPGRDVLRNVSFRLARGKTLAIVGASGSGKSSLVSLLPRIFDVTGGKIEIDGQDIRELSLEDLRRMVSVVSQDVFLFNDSIEENIRCGRLSATREEIRAAAKKAHAADFIESAPQGYQSIIGDRGQKLSGGERQRISIARAFLRESPILILDEATSSLDTTSERAVQAALDELMVDRTTIMIAHRLSTIQNADEIIVMKEGAIIETGRHAELLAARGEYSRFHESSRT